MDEDRITVSVESLSSEMESNNTDEWGCAIGWINNEMGCEYNYCIDNGENCSAIYAMHWNGEPDADESTVSTDGSDFEHYEVDFKDENWEKKLKKAMIKFMLKRW